VRVCHRFAAGSARFDEDNLVSQAGLVRLLGLAEQTRLPEIIAEKVSITISRIKSAAANPVPKLLGVIAGMCAGADSIEDLDVLRAGGMPILFDGVYAPSTLGTLLREFSFGHARQLESVLREHLCALAERTELLVGIYEQVFIDIDSLLRPVFGHAKQGASLRAHQDRRQAGAAQGIVPAGHHDQHRALRAGDRRDAAARGPDRLGKGRRAGWSPRPSPPPAPPAPEGREDPGPRRFGLRQPRGSTRLPTRQGGVLPGDGQEPGHSARHRLHSGRGLDPGALPGRGAGSRHRGVDLRRRGRRGHLHRLRHTTDRITARLVVRRVKDARYPDGSGALFPVWRYHPFFTNTDLSTAQADIVHRRHAIIETVFADLDGPLAHLPSGRFGANSAWACAPRSRTTCSTPPAPSPGNPRPSPGAQPCADG
jgi:hypothetical protein